jgi:hypothetical protein
MPVRREEIIDFGQKMEGLQNLLGYKDIFERFCAVIGLKREALKACLTDTGTRGLSKVHQQAMRDALRGRLGDFLKWPEWIDSDLGRIARDGRRDSAASFLQRCREALIGSVNSGIPLRLAIVDNPPPILESLGSVELFPTAQFVAGQDGTLGGTLICRAANLDEARIAVRFCKLRLNRRPLPTEAITGARPNVIAPLENDKGVEVTLQRVGTSQLPTFEIRAARGAIEMVHLPDDLWPVIAAMPDDSYQVQVVVYLRDCRLVDEDDAEDSELQIISPEEGNSFIGPGPKKMGHMLKLIEARIAELKAFDFEDGYGVLHSYAVKAQPVNQVPAGGAKK